MSKMSDSEYQFNSNKHNRRSSILKPAKVVDNRAPLQELGASSDDTTTTASIYKKRVSFHVINIKEYSTHAQTQEVQKGPAYNEFLSSMSDSSRNNTNNECSSFSPMVPAYVIPQDEDKENQINYGDDTDSSVEDDSSEICEDNHNEPFDLSTNAKSESKNFLESTKLSHCNTIMTTFNISGIQNLDETNMQDLDESDDSSFQRMIDQQPPAVNLFNYQDSRKSLSRKSLSANRETQQEQPVLNLFQSQPDSRKSVSRKSISAVSAHQEEQENAFQYQQEVRKSTSRKSISAYHEPEPDNSSDSIELTCHVSLRNVPSALDESSSMEMTTALPKRKSFAPRKSVNFKCTQDESQSDEMEFTSAFPPMTHGHAGPDEAQLEESAMEVTGVFPRKSFGPTKFSDMDSSSSLDGMPTSKKSLSNKPGYTKSMELTSSLSESRQSSEISNPEKTQNASSMDMVSMYQKSSRKSISGNAFKNIENLDESGMEMTEAFNVIPPNLNTTDCTSNDVEYPSDDVSMSESISDMDISNQSPPNAMNATQSMLADKTNFANASSVDFTIKTSFASNISRKSISAKNMWELNDAPSNHDILRNPISSSNAIHYKSFSGFENSATHPSSMLNRKSAPYGMMLHESRDIVPSLDRSNHQPDAPGQECKTLNKSGSSINVISITGRKSVPQTKSSFISQSNVNEINDKSTIPVNVMPFNNSNIELNSSVHNQSKFTQDFTSFTSVQPVPMAHSTNLNISLEPKNSSLLIVSQEASLNHENNSVPLNQTSPQRCKSSAELTAVQQKEPINSSNHEDSMELSCAFPLISKSAYSQVDNSRMEMSSVALQANTSDSKSSTEQVTEQLVSKANNENSIMTNINISVMQTESMQVTVSRENMAETIYSAGNQIQETRASTTMNDKSKESMHVTVSCENMGETINSAGDQIQETIASTSSSEKPADCYTQRTLEKTVPDVYNMSVDCSTLTSQTAETNETSDNNFPKEDENEQLPSITDINEPSHELSHAKKNESQKALQDNSSGHKNESFIPSNVSTDDGFSSTRGSHQFNESGVSPLKSAQATLVDSEGERSRKRPSDGFEAHEENLILCGDSNTVVVANPKKRSKTFEMEAFQESPEVDPATCESRINEAASPSNKTCSIDTDHDEYSTAVAASETPVVVRAAPIVSSNPAKTTTVSETPSKSSLAAETPNKPVQVPATPNKTPVVADTLSKTPLVSSTPRKTPTVSKNPSKTPTVASNSCKTPMFVTPIKPPVFATPRKDLTFVTPGKIRESNDSQDSIDSCNLSTYANPSSTLTDSIINNITDIMGLPLSGSVRKHSASEVKAKKISSCSTPLLPNSCSKTVIVDRFFQSIDNRGKKSESFVVPSKNIIKKLDLTRGESKQDSPNNLSPGNATFSSGSSGSCENTPVDSSVDTNLTLKRTKDQLNISRSNDPNSSNYIPEKQQRNTSMNIINTSRHSTIESVVNDISLLDISADLEKIDHIQSALATTLNITDVPDKSMRDHTSFNHTLSVLNETETASNIEVPCKQNNELDKPKETYETTEVLKVIETDSPEKSKAIEVVKEMHTRATEEKNQSLFKEIVTNSPKPPTTYPNSQSDVNKLDQTNSTENSHPTGNSKPKNHDIESSDQDLVERAIFMKKRKSRLSIVPKQSPVKAAPSQNDTKRKTLKIQPKKCMMFESGDDSVEEVQDYAERNILAEEKRGSHEWKLKTLELSLWEFEFLNGLIVLRVEFSQEGKKSRKDKVVKNISFETTDASTELRSLCFKLLHSKYSKLSSMCSSSCDVIPLLQHISPFMSYLRQFARAMKLCELKYGLKLQGTTMLVDIKSYSKLEWSQVSLDLKDIDFITPNDINVKRMFGNITESEVRKQFPVFATRDNADFIKTFIEKIYSFLDTK